MKSFWNKRRIIYGILILASALVTLFVWNFRKWLDVSGGTRLVYRISYDNYEQTYGENSQALTDIKQTVEEIILKNIDWRISQLWVSDYRSYTQQLDNETQIVVEIWWIADLDQAKELIGKTVELEFKLPNDSTWSGAKAERTALAQNIYDDLLENPDKFEAIANSRQSENIFYTKYDNVSLSQLPNIYQDNIKVLDETQEWKVSPLMEGLYLSTQQQDESGNIQNIDINGYTFFHIISKNKWVRTGVNLYDILEVANTLWATYDENYQLAKDWLDIASGSYKIEWTTLRYNDGEVLPNQEAYDARILAIVPDSLDNTNASGDNTEATNFQDKVNTAKDTLLADYNAEIDWAIERYNGLISTNDLKSSITSFDSNNSDKVQVYEQDGISYLIVIKDKKSITDHWYNVVDINWVNEDEFKNALQSQTFYTLEEVFIQDELSWVNAQSSDGKILNGANFKYARVDTSQMWQPVVLINFDEIWKSVFCDITEHNIWRQMAIFIWWEKITSPVIQTKICDGSAQIDGNFTAEGAKELTNQLNDGALPAPLILMQEEKVSPTLWENALNGALIAMWVGFIVIFLYMVYLYGWKKWLISLISLTVYTLALLTIVKIVNYALSLSGIAAIILSIWMAVDANVLIFERMKEEKANNKSDHDTINTAYDRSWNAIRDGQISTWMIGLLLMVMWINMFKWFGTMLVIWVLLTLFINAPIIKELLHAFYQKK